MVRLTCYLFDLYQCRPRRNWLNKNSKQSMRSTRKSVKVQKSRRRCQWPCFHGGFADQHSSSAQSTLTNKSRLKLLHRREEHLQDLFSVARSSLLSLAQDEGRYIQFLEGVIVQGFLQVLEPIVTIHSRTCDVGVAKQAAESAVRTYKKISGRDIEFDVEGTLGDEG
jgi:ATP synthase (E/31 kDa) subunit